MTTIIGTGNFIETMKNGQNTFPEKGKYKDKILRVGERVSFNKKSNEQSVLEVETIYGVVKWISLNGKIVGVEFDEKITEPLPGAKLYSPEFFSCTPDRTRIILGSDLALVSTLTEQNGFASSINKNFTDSTKKKTAKILKAIPPPKMSQIVTEPGRGLEWQANSCYLDATLFSMFYATEIFDDTLLSDKTQKEPKDQLSQQVMTILRNEIVHPLRTNLRCSGTNTAKLRDALKHLSNRIQCSFMDAEDFLFLLLEKSLNIQEFLMYSTGVSDFMHQIIIDNNDPRKIGFVQDLLETSMRLNDDLKLDGVPRPAFLVEMPRCDGSMVKFDAVVPNLTINITEFLSEASCVCGKNGTWVCFQCTEVYETRGQTRCRWVCFCDAAANEHIVFHKNHQMHTTEILRNPVQMDLLAVICVRHHHYTTFVKCGKERFAPWLYFNSSDKVRPIKEMGKWLDKLEKEHNNVENIWRGCPEELRRIALDCHICIYQPRGRSQ